MFFFQKTVSWAFLANSKTLLFPLPVSTELEKLYISLFNSSSMEYPSPLFEYSDYSNEKFQIDLGSMRMRSLEGDKSFEVKRVGHEKTQMLGISLVVCRNKEGKYLAVNELKNRGWYLPAGRVNPPESFPEAAIRETLEEASIDIDLKGVLKNEHNFSADGSFLRYRVIFYGEPKDEGQKPKSVPDSESLEARWCTLTELRKLSMQPPYLRGQELLEWGEYIEKGGTIYPLDIFQEN